MPILQGPSPSAPLRPRAALPHLLRKPQGQVPPSKTEEDCPLEAPENGPTFQEKYQPGRLLGSGAFADVWSCVEKPKGCLSGEPGPAAIPGHSAVAAGGASALAGVRNEEAGREWACKEVRLRGLGSAERALVAQEVAALRLLQSRQHPGIVGLREVLRAPGSVQIVLEHCAGGDLQQLLERRERLSEPGARTVLRQVASALACCHELGIIHRDVKPANILFSADPYFLCAKRGRSGKLLQKVQQQQQQQQQQQGPPPVQAKLVDFGLSVTVQPRETTAGASGSPSYMAPEVLRGKSYGTEVDVWSLGVLLCLMLSGEHPFPALCEAGQQRLWWMQWGLGRAKVDFSRRCWEGVSEEAMELVQRMLEVDGRKRLSASQVLLDPWCREGDAPVPVPVSVVGPVLVPEPVHEVPRASEPASLGQADQSLTGQGRSHSAASLRDSDCRRLGSECTESTDVVQGQREGDCKAPAANPFMWNSRIWPGHSPQRVVSSES